MKIFNYKLQFIHCYQVQKPRHVDSVPRPEGISGMTMTTTSCEGPEKGPEKGPEIIRLGVLNLPRGPDCSRLALSAVAQARALKR